MKKASLFLISLLCLILLVSCKPAGGPSDSSESPDTTNTDNSAGKLTIVENKSTEYIVLRPDVCSTEVTNAAVEVRKKIMDTYGLSKIDIKSDFEKAGTDPSSRWQYEILVGLTNRDESLAAYEEIKYNDFIIRVSGTRVVLLGGCDEKTVEAVNYFMENYIKGDSLSIDSGLHYIKEGSYAAAGLTLDGVDISKYRIIYTTEYKEAAEKISTELGKLCGARLSIAHESSAAQEYEIVLGSTKRGVTGSYGYDDFAIRTEGSKIFIGGGSAYAVSSGCRSLINLLAKGGEISLSSLAYTYTLPAREDYINNISLLIPHWSLEWQTPEWMLDFDEKYTAMNDPDGRLMSCLHRSDMLYYPENSIEGIISAILMGGDMIEIDLRKTKDGVLVLLHDETLTRTTNVASLRGKNGLPNNDKLSEWTYAQLQELNLTMNGVVTPYKIPTFEEAMKVCSERIFLRLDKLDQWDYNKEIWPLIQKYNAYSTVIFTWHSVFKSNNYALVKNYKSRMIAAAGRSSFCFVGMTASNNAVSTLSTIMSNSLDYCIRFTDFDLSAKTPDDYLKEYSTVLKGLKGKARVYIDAHGKSSAYETADNWSKLYDAGINVLLVNKGLYLCMYIGQNYSATAK